jgi:hypothetical protein
VDEIIEVSAVTLQEAEDIALNEPNVLWVVDKAYDREQLEGSQGRDF